MGHYDSCREETWKPMETKCSGNKLKGKEKKTFNGDHKWDMQGGGYGVCTCKYCDKVIYWT